MQQEFLARARDGDRPVLGAKARVVKTPEQVEVFGALLDESIEDAAWNVASGYMSMYPADTPAPPEGDELAQAKHRLVGYEWAESRFRLESSTANIAPLIEKRVKAQVELRRIQQSMLRGLMARAVRPMRRGPSRAARSSSSRSRVASRSAGGGGSGDRPADPEPPSRAASRVAELLLARAAEAVTA